MALFCSNPQATSLDCLAAIRLPLSPPIVGIVILLQLETVAGHVDKNFLFGAELLRHCLVFEIPRVAHTGAKASIRLAGNSSRKKAPGGSTRRRQPMRCILAPCSASPSTASITLPGVSSARSKRITRICGRSASLSSGYYGD